MRVHMLTKCISPNALHPDASGIKCVPNIGFIVAYQMSAEVYPTEVRWGGVCWSRCMSLQSFLQSPDALSRKVDYQIHCHAWAKQNAWNQYYMEIWASHENACSMGPIAESEVFGSFKGRKQGSWVLVHLILRGEVAWKVSEQYSEIISHLLNVLVLCS